ncbi:aspartyl-tRNA synthetase [Desulfurococcus amylolyticus 1221n]|uniref:Aspartate--tRNA ligase n=1 Tax=Desulfurococcus amylolyticus (strain DSM 18924 / JCM 16383 / VKM B-2413 / 1221n) TaxID=490899 RepID=B8D556_DESA1|nr:aspartate--tRNA(Asn) ligase [Desulfurococcus amylolyticus]ACL11237.1 aspartyl-tRNA synthetase [Desulfurococcus amylolyticus 1221n]
MGLKRICGWIIRKKSIGRIIIIEVSSDSVKPSVLVLKEEREPELFKLGMEIDIGTALCFEGEEAPEQRSARGVEYIARKIEVYAKPIEPLPVDTMGKVPALLDTRIKYRWLLVRNPVEKAIFIIRNSLLNAAREYFSKNGFIEVQTPKIVAAGAEGGATLFKIQYFENDAYLSQSPQLFKQMLMAGFTRIYEITPYFRAEKYNTTRHLNESWGIDVEQGFINSVEDVLQTLENLITYIIEYVLKNNKEELEILGATLKKPSSPFKRLKFQEAVDILRSEGLEISEAEDLSDYAEKKLGEIMTEKGYELYFIVGFPWASTGFYYMRDEDGVYTRKFDLDYRGLEIASGGQREHRYEKLLKALREKGLNPENFGFYLEAFKYGMPPHGGFGLGVERLLMRMLNLENVREAILFVRDRTRLVP